MYGVEGAEGSPTPQPLLPKNARFLCSCYPPLLCIPAFHVAPWPTTLAPFKHKQTSSPLHVAIATTTLNRPPKQKCVCTRRG